MCGCSITIKSKNRLIRKYGGNRADIKALYNKYKNISIEEFLKSHKNCNEDDYNTLELSVKLNKK